MLLPQELKKTQFSRAMRGYAAAEVDEYIEFLVSKYEILYRENDELERKLNAAVKTLDEMRAREKKVFALEAAMKESAARLLADAEAKRNTILGDAVAEAEKITAEADKHVAAQEQIFLQMQAEVAALRDTLFAAYSDHVDRIEQLTAVSAGASFGAAAPVPPSALDEIGEEILPESPEAEVAAEDAIEAEELTEDEPQTPAEEEEEPVSAEDCYTEAELFEEETPAADAEDTSPLLQALDADTYTEEELSGADDPFFMNEADESSASAAVAADEEFEEIFDEIFEEIYESSEENAGDGFSDASSYEDEIFAETYSDEELVQEDTESEVLEEKAEALENAFEDTFEEAEESFEEAFAEAVEEASAPEDEDALLLKELNDAFVHNFESSKEEAAEAKADPVHDDIMKALAEAIEEEPKGFDIDSFEFLPETAGAENDGDI